jgi:hypothetical protein
MALRKLAPLDARRICDQMFFLVKDHADSGLGLEDDLTMLAIEYTGRPQGAIRTGGA